VEREKGEGGVETREEIGVEREGWERERGVLLGAIGEGDGVRVLVVV